MNQVVEEEIPAADHGKDVLLEKGIVIQIVIAPVVLHVEQIIAEQRHYLEAIGEVAQIAALVRLFLQIFYDGTQYRSIYD